MQIPKIAFKQIEKEKAARPFRNVVSGDFDASRSIEAAKFARFLEHRDYTSSPLEFEYNIPTGAERDDASHRDHLSDERSLWPDLAFEETKSGYSYFKCRAGVKPPYKTRFCQTHNIAIEGKFIFLRGPYAKGGQFDWCKKLLAEGRCNREIARVTGAAKNTVAKYRRYCEKVNGVAFVCPCGKPAIHQGWCSIRFAKSEKRIDFIAKWTAPKTKDKNQGFALIGEGNL